MKKRILPALLALCLALTLLPGVALAAEEPRADILKLSYSTDGTTWTELTTTCVAFRWSVSEKNLELPGDYVWLKAEAGAGLDQGKNITSLSISWQCKTGNENIMASYNFPDAALGQPVKLPLSTLGAYGDYDGISVIFQTDMDYPNNLGTYHLGDAIVGRAENNLDVSYLEDWAGTYSASTGDTALSITKDAGGNYITAISDEKESDGSAATNNLREMHFDVTNDGVASNPYIGFGNSANAYFDMAQASDGSKTLTARDHYSYRNAAGSSKNGFIPKGAVFTMSAVASVNGYGYTSLADAIDAAPSGQTVTLLDDITASGVVIESGKNLTVDFAGHTYTIGQPLVGSSGTETNGFQLKKDSNITFKNGKIDCASAKILIQNYANLTLENMELVSKGPYVLSLNNGNINITGNTSIQNTGGESAFDVSWWPSSYPDGTQVTLNTTGTITGDITLGIWGAKAAGLTAEQKNPANVKSSLAVQNVNHVGEIKADYATSGDFACGCSEDEIKAIVQKMGSITGGTFSTDPSDYVAAGYTVRTNDDGTYTVLYPYTPPVEAPVVDVPVKGDEGTVSVPVQVDTSKGEASLVVDDEKLAEIVGSGAASGTVTIDTSALDENVTTVSVPANTITAINEAVQSETGAAESLVVALPAASIEFDAAALDTVAAAMEADTKVSISAETVSAAALPEDHKTMVGDDAVVVELSVKVDDKPVSSFGGGAVTVTIDYTPKAGTDTKNLTVWYLSDDGKLTPCACEYANGKLVFKTSHFSKYVVGEFPFTDVKGGEWYYENVVYAYANGIMNGMSETEFNPSGTTTRGMIVTLLWRLAGEPSATAAAGFTDVADSAYYAKAVAWAAEKGLVDGYGDGTFRPEDAITREQLATILWRYKGRPATTGELNFPDAENVSSWAKDALIWATAKGLVNGSDGELLPAGPALRCQVAAITQRMAAL